MIEELKPYPSYKDSGVAWLGEVPEDWKLRRLKHAFRRIVGGSTPDSNEKQYWDGDIVWVTPADVSRHERLTTSLRKITKAGLSACSSELVPQGSVIVTSRAPVGNVALACVELCTNQGCKALVPDDSVIDGRFALAVMRLLGGELQSLAGGTTFAEISTTKLGTVRMPVPPVADQAAIVRFINHADTRIHRHIHAKQKLIKLLDEEKQAIIHRAVTRGLDANVRFKPSGVAWLGDVPEHWEVVALKRVCNLLRDGTHLPPRRMEVGFPLLSVRNIVQGKFVRRVDDTFISERDYLALCRSFVPQKNDVLLAIVGATLGKVAVVPEMQPFQIQRSLALFRPIPNRLLPDFLAMYLASTNFQSALWTTVAFSAQPGIYLNTLGNFHAVIPPLGEQDNIVRDVAQKTQQLNRGISIAEREISLLREFRTRLIADVVTGKLDVRKAAAKLPEESPEPEPLDEMDELSQDGATADDFELETADDV
jgi:type I restriction enzyme S subunit